MQGALGLSLPALFDSLGNFISTAERVRLPDDCTIGYIIEGLLDVRLLHSPLFHSHLENLQRLQGEAVLQQVGTSLGLCSVPSPARALLPA